MDLLEPGDPRQVGRFRLIGRLGGGGMGRVFLGVSPGGRQVAVKLIHSELTGDKQFRERFAREIDAARRVGGFHTAPVIDADPDADPPWMVTLYIPGPLLQDAVAARGPLSLDQVCRLGAELAEGLAAIHGYGLVHRDLKPSNVILAERGFRQLISECLAKSPDRRPSLAGIVTRLTEPGSHAAALTVESLPGDARRHEPTQTIHSGDRAVPDRAADLQRPGRGAPRRTMLIAAGVAVIALLAAGLGILLSSGRPKPPPPAPGPSSPTATASASLAPTTPEATLRDPGGKSVYGVAFSRAGGLLAAGDTDGRVYLWNVASGKLTATLRDPDSHGLYDVAFSPDGRLIAVSDIVSGSSGVVYLWNVATGKLAATWSANDGSDIADIAFSPNGRFLAAADTLGSVIVWNVASGTLLADLPDPHGQSLIAVAFSPDGRTIATTNTGGDAYLWNASWLGS